MKAVVVMLAALAGCVHTSHPGEFTLYQWVDVCTPSGADLVCSKQYRAVHYGAHKEIVP